ncbi:hypothetical protein NOR_02606 [Metarhizium rileyi]|uniref:Uncharacterized protein n=1 Tax=Metarhizium rileyi (strain RCEF 4871) TaxID=1649241 RepID=A0A162LY94_METRR|nr:hypothetical protein NOR_02606 [Metarhizium rileyi RCEF 4871]
MFRPLRLAYAGLASPGRTSAGLPYTVLSCPRSSFTPESESKADKNSTLTLTDCKNEDEDEDEDETEIRESRIDSDQ